MAIILDNNTNYDISEKLNQLIGKVVAECINHEKCPYIVEVSITLVDNEEIKKINKEFRNIDLVTDVLSFPLIEFVKPSGWQFIYENNLDDFLNLDTEELMLGDIVISLEKAEEQAKTYGHSFEREIGFLIVHSMLHLFGYDHISEDEEKIMFEIQEQILEEVGLVR